MNRVKTRIIVLIFIYLLNKPQTNHNQISLTLTRNNFHFSENRALRSGMLNERLASSSICWTIRIEIIMMNAFHQLVYLHGTSSCAYWVHFLLASNSLAHKKRRPCTIKLCISPFIAKQLLAKSRVHAVRSRTGSR